MSRQEDFIQAGIKYRFEHSKPMYADESGRLGICDITKKKNEFEFGKSRRVYRIDGTWYKTKEEFVEALKRFGFGPQSPKERRER